MWPFKNKNKKRKRMQVILVTDKDEQSPPFVLDVGAVDVTIQVASADKSKPFSGTVLIEGTVDDPKTTDKWSPVASTAQEEVIRLSGYTLAGLRATTTLMKAGEVSVLVLWR